MQRSLAVGCLALALACQPAWAAGNRAVPDVKPASDSDHFKSKDGFNGLLLITDDAKWEDEWNTPEDHVPHFTQAHNVKVGGALHIVAFLFNPQLDAQSMADVACDFVVTRPDGSTSVDEKDFECFKAKVEGDPHGMYRTSAWMKFVPQAGFLKGTYHVVVVLHDRNRGVDLTLEDAFVNE